MRHKSPEFDLLYTNVLYDDTTSFKNFTSFILGRAVAWWLRHYATNRQVVGSIPDGVTGIFQ
jgi:hypothetical protein